MSKVTINRINVTAKEQELIDRMNKTVGKKIPVTDGNQKIIAKPVNPIQKVINSDEYLIDKMNQALKQPRDSKGRFASNKTQGTQTRPQEEKVEEVQPVQYTFDKLCDNLKEVHAAKNADYGNSWVKHLMKYGLRPFTMRASEKINRIDSIIDNGKAYVKDESIIDTLIDIAAYALMTAAELQDDKDGVILSKSK
jgi:hypothetical protein